MPLTALVTVRRINTTVTLSWTVNQRRSREFFQWTWRDD